MIPLGEQIADVYRRMHRLLVKRLAQETHRPWTQLKALRMLADGDDIHTQAALADRLLMDAPSVSRLVTRLEEDGLLTRCEGPDRRCVHLEVTAAAGPELESTERSIRWLEGALTKHLSDDERSTLLTLLEKLAGGLKNDASGA